MPSTMPTMTASAGSQLRQGNMHGLCGSFGMVVYRTHAELAATRLALKPCGGSQFTVKEFATAHVRFGSEADLRSQMLNDRH